MGSGAARSEAVGRARVHRGGAADDRARRDHRQHCAAVGAGSPRRLRRRPAMGRHRLHACLRRPAAPGWPDRRLPGAQAGLHDRPGRLCPGLPGWRRGAELRRPGRRPRGAGRARGAACAHRSCSACNLVHRGPRARHGVRGVRIDRRQRSGDRDAARGGAYLAVGLALAGMFGAYLFLTYDFQVVMHYTPLQAGLAFLPITVASQAGSWLIARRLMPLTPPRALMAPGALVAAAGLVLLTQLHAGSSFVSVVLPAELLLGLGLSTAMVPAFSVATHGVDPREAGVASATVNAAQQVGASLGVAVLNTIAATATAAYLGPRTEAVLHGFAQATGWGAAIMVLSAVVAALLVRAPRPSRQAR